MYFVEEQMRIAAEMKASGTWVDSMYKMRVKWECQNWEECWRAWPWKWSIGYNYEKARFLGFISYILILICYFLVGLM
jgi:hypothetical protein